MKLITIPNEISIQKCVRGSSTAQGWFNALVIKAEYIRFQIVQSAWF